MVYMARVLQMEVLKATTVYKIQETEFDYVVPDNISSISITKEQGIDNDDRNYYYIVVNGNKILYGILNRLTEPMVFQQKEKEIYRDMRTEVGNILDAILMRRGK